MSKTRNDAARRLVRSQRALDRLLAALNSDEAFIGRYGAKRRFRTIHEADKLVLRIAALSAMLGQ